MTKTYAVLLLLLATAGCAQIRQKYETGREFSRAMQLNHGYRAYYMPSDSMAPTVRTNGQMLVDLSAYDSVPPQRGDIIVFKPPVGSQNAFTKRIIALPGDKVRIRGGTIELNGRAAYLRSPRLRPNYDVEVSSYRIAVDGEALDPAGADVPPRSAWTAPDRLPRGCYFVLGDNVDNSEDSHVFGCAELRGTFSAGPRKGEPAEVYGKVVKIVNPRG